MGLFDKKFCDVCGEKIRFLGNRKLEDGNLCKSCADQLSPWFSERRHSTVADIKAQLADREANKQRAAAFQADVRLGDGNVLCVDNGKKQFMVLRSGESAADNPDVIGLSQVTQCEVQIEDSKTEEKQRDKEGNLVPYNPPRYTYRYTFYLSIRLNHPYLDDIRFRINRSAVEIKTGMPVQMPGIFAALNVTTANDPRPEENEDYRRFQALGIEMRKALTQAAPDGDRMEHASAAAAFVPAQPVQCPACSARVFPDENGCCPYCGTKL